MPFNAFCVSSIKLKMKMTKKVLKDICRKLDLYGTPELNDKLYLHYKGEFVTADLTFKNGSFQVLSGLKIWKNTLGCECFGSKETVLLKSKDWKLS